MLSLFVSFFVSLFLCFFSGGLKNRTWTGLKVTTENSNIVLNVAPPVD